MVILGGKLISDFYFIIFAHLFSNVSIVKILCNTGKKSLIEKLDPKNSEEFYSVVFTSCNLLILTLKPLFTSTTVISFNWTHGLSGGHYISEPLMQLVVAMWLRFQQWNVSRTNIWNLYCLLNVFLFFLWTFPQAKTHRGSWVSFDRKERITSYRMEKQYERNLGLWVKL